MNLLREITKLEEPTEDEESSVGPHVPEDGWNVGQLANHGVLLSCDGFIIKLDLDQLNILFDLAEDGESGEVRDHNGAAVFVEVGDNGIVLSRNDDETFPNGVLLDLDTLKEIGIEQDNDQPTDDSPDDAADDTIDVEDSDLTEGIKRAFRRAGKKIKRGFRVTSGFRKGRVVSSAKAAFKPRKKASTRMKLRLAMRKKKIVRIMKAKRTRMKPLSKRLVRMNKRVSGK